MSHIGKFFRDRRLERGLTPGQLARLVGYQNLSKGSNRIQKFELGGKIDPDLLEKLASALEIGRDEIRRLEAEEYQEWLRWANEPIRPYVVLKHLACVYERVELQDDALVPEAAEAFAAHLAREQRSMVCLVLSRRLSVHFDSTGRLAGRLEATPDRPCEPYAVIGGRRVQFDFGGGNVLHPIDEPNP